MDFAKAYTLVYGACCGVIRSAVRDMIRSHRAKTGNKNKSEGLKNTIISVIRV